MDLFLFVDDDDLYCRLFLLNSPIGVATVYNLGFVVDCCTIDPLSDISGSQTFSLKYGGNSLARMVFVKCLLCLFSLNLFFHLYFSVRDSCR